ncbi:hypothetical protein NE236_33790 [Actinoallomurus purpureus]|uniref:hypothetical protein n=1 Tax=Actinoallomurus purpureus TaxID=478114 RepID=UPI002093F0A6|nr:hypothetical protein [Actinoallomurus purpureus]MCO6009957.1 hypothetical protein [Actinoallomurus purpureus]
MRKSALIVAALACTVVGAGASAASAATAPKPPHSWNLDKKVKPADARTAGQWSRHGKKFTISGRVQDYSPGDAASASVVVSVRLSGKLVLLRQYFTDTKKGRTFAPSYTAKTAAQAAKVKISVQKCLFKADDTSICSKDTPVR